MKKKISIITGVAGTIGSNLAKNLIKDGHFIYGIDNFSLGKQRNIFSLKKNKNFKLIKCDLSSKENIPKIKNKIDYIWLLAANSDIKAGIKNPEIDLKNTFFSTLNTINAYFRNLNSNSRIFFASSSAVYGDVKNKISEKYNLYYPISNYGECKFLSEIYLNKFCKNKKIQLLITRFPNVVGKPFTHGVIFDLANKIKRKKFLEVLGDGSQKKPYVHVKELIECIKFLMIKKKIESPYLLGPNDNGITVKSLSKILTEYFKYKKKIVFGKKKFGWIGDVPKYSYNVSKLNNAGFKFKLSSQKAIKLAIKEKYDD